MKKYQMNNLNKQQLDFQLIHQEIKNNIGIEVYSNPISQVNRLY